MNRKRHRRVPERYSSLALATVVLLILAVASQCRFPYNPEPQPQPLSGRSADSSTTLFPINSGRQICNPSASQDTVNFPASMLYLNLAGSLPVVVPEKWKNDYNNFAEQPHDRLTVIDTANTVRWFLMKPAFIPQSEMQDPEWSVNPGYIVFLGDEDNSSDGYVVRIADKAVLRFNKGRLQSNSTPHLWLPPSAVAAPNPDAVPSLWGGATARYTNEGMAVKEDVAAFFGTDSVLFAFATNEGSSGLTIRYIDYRDAAPAIQTLVRPPKRNGMACESPLISPDGSSIVYNCRNGSLSCEAWLQRLTPGSEPLLIHQGTAAEPHWWKDGEGGVFVMYCTAIGPLSESLESAVQDGSLGSTIIRAVNLKATLAWQVLTGDKQTIAGLPFQGGCTADGRFLATGYQFGYLLKLPALR